MKKIKDLAILMRENMKDNHVIGIGGLGLVKETIEVINDNTLCLNGHDVEFSYVDSYKGCHLFKTLVDGEKGSVAIIDDDGYKIDDYEYNILNKLLDAYLSLNDIKHYMEKMDETREFICDEFIRFAHFMDEEFMDAMGMIDIVFTLYSRLEPGSFGHISRVEHKLELLEIALKKDKE